MELKPNANVPNNPADSKRIVLRADKGSVMRKDDLPKTVTSALQAFLFQQSLFPYEFKDVEAKEDPANPNKEIVYTISGASVGKAFKLEVITRAGNVTSTRLVS
jgi:hypothetical protein